MANDVILPPDEVKSLLAAGKASGAPVILQGHMPGVIIPDGYKFEPLPFTERLPCLPMTSQFVQLSDDAAFCQYVKRYQTLDTVIFATLPQNADGSGAEFRAVFDYHPKEVETEDGVYTYYVFAKCSHQAAFPCPLSPNWQTWFKASGKGLSQTDFINFIEANTADITAPNAAALMELAINFESKTEVEFLSKIDRVTGARKLTFNEVINNSRVGGSLTVPDSLSLKLPVFEGGKEFVTTARLEWRPTNGKLTVTIHLLRAGILIREALADLRAEIAEEVGIVPMTGKLL